MKYWFPFVIALLLVTFVFFFGNVIAEPLKIFGLLLVAASAFLALIFLFFANQIVYGISIIREFQELQESYGTLSLDLTPIPTPYLVGDFVQRRFEEVSHSSNRADLLLRVKHLRVGNIVNIASRQRPPLRNLTRELQAYSFLLLSFFIIGLLMHSNDLQGKSLAEIANAVVSEKFIPLVEVFAIVYLVVRFFSELGWIRALVEGE